MPHSDTPDLFTPPPAPRNGGGPAAPLAERMRPRTLAEVAGQQHLLAPGKLLRRAIESDRFTSLLLHGPPGTGKTTLASVIAECTGARFEALNGVEAGVTDLRDVIERARIHRDRLGKSTILFLDEIHRFNKDWSASSVPPPSTRCSMSTLRWYRARWCSNWNPYRSPRW
jgi:putative ATPase